MAQIQRNFRRHFHVVHAPELKPHLTFFSLGVPKRPNLFQSQTKDARSTQGQRSPGNSQYPSGNIPKSHGQYGCPYAECDWTERSIIMWKTLFEVQRVNQGNGGQFVSFPDITMFLKFQNGYIFWNTLYMNHTGLLKPINLRGSVEIIYV